ncbi:MAG: hypothetical protein GC164_01000 [Phycisphaera sp.]|nr:hypothetical protein [Phycisphaera sp.]
MKPATQQADRRQNHRVEPTGHISVNRAMPFLPLSDAEVVNVSKQGVALRTCVPLVPGERLSFRTEPHLPPILAEVLGVERADGKTFTVRCRCLLGGFDV